MRGNNCQYSKVVTDWRANLREHTPTLQRINSQIAFATPSSSFVVVI